MCSCVHVRVRVQCNKWICWYNLPSWSWIFRKFTTQPWPAHHKSPQTYAAAHADLAPGFPAMGKKDFVSLLISTFEGTHCTVHVHVYSRKYESTVQRCISQYNRAVAWRLTADRARVQPDETCNNYFLSETDLHTVHEFLYVTATNLRLQHETLILIYSMVIINMKAWVLNSHINSILREYGSTEVLPEVHVRVLSEVQIT